MSIPMTNETQEISDKIDDCEVQLADLETIYGTPVFLMALSGWLWNTGAQMTEDAKKLKPPTEG